MSLRTLSPEAAKRLIDEGATLIDIREANEFARERIPGARNVALSRIDGEVLDSGGAKQLIFHCRSGARTQANATRLAVRAGGCEAYVLEGGLDRWKKAGLPVALDRGQPLELQRQVQLGAGTLAFLGTLAGVLVSPWFLIVPGFVGAGLMVAGATGFCGMARLLVHAPWNRAMAH
jgi:rhodanese-related sulfurtransferase